MNRPVNTFLAPAKQTQSLAELENLYASLSQWAFKGELDLSGVAEDGTGLVAGFLLDNFYNSE